MIFVLFGATGEVGDITRKYFKSHGISSISKKNYIIDPTLVQMERVNGDIVSREEIEKCAFRYEISGRTVGFEFADIDRAGQGYENVYMTLSAFERSILIDLRNAYGEKVRIIYINIDPQTLKEITNARTDLDATQKQDRIENGKKLRYFFLKNRALFDIDVYYEETEELSRQEYLQAQYELIIIEALERQSKLDSDQELKLPYLGQGKYVFVSYSHDDLRLIRPLLLGLLNKKCKIWYDKGLETNADEEPVNLLWEDKLRERISNCSQFLIFRSKNSVKKPWVWQEFNWALETGIPVTVVRLDDKQFGREKFDFYDRYQNPTYHQDNISFVEDIDRYLINDVRVSSDK